MTSDQPVNSAPSVIPIYLADEFSLNCSECGYDLRGLANSRCPECGRLFDPQSLRSERDQNLKRQFHDSIGSPQIVAEVISLSVGYNGMLYLCLSKEAPEMAFIIFLLTFGFCIAGSHRWAHGHMQFKRLRAGRANPSSDDKQEESRLRVLLLCIALFSTILVLPIVLFIAI